MAKYQQVFEVMGVIRKICKISNRIGKNEMNTYLEALVYPSHKGFFVKTIGLRFGGSVGNFVRNGAVRRWCLCSICFFFKYIY